MIEEMAEEPLDEPALFGGEPAFPNGLPPWPIPDPLVRRAVEEAMADGSWGQYHGPRVKDLNRHLAGYHDVAHSLTCVSGTFAIEVALRALTVGAGDEVIMAAYDYEPTFLTIHALGAIPVLVDIDQHNANLNLVHLETAITPHTKAIIVSHLHGGLVPMREVMAVARTHSIPVIEDACQSIGATIEGRIAGTSGDIGVLSFGGSKLLSAGRGGALLTANSALYQRARLILQRGNQQLAPLSELQAATLIPQLQQLDERNRLRAENVRLLLELLADIPGLTPFRNDFADGSPVFYRVGFYFDEQKFGLGRDQFIAAMRAEGVAFAEGFRALHVGRNPKRLRAPGPLPHATHAHESVVGLHHPVLLGTEADIRAVARAVHRTYRNADRLRRRM